MILTKGKQDSQCLALLLSQILVSQMFNSVHTLSIVRRINATVTLNISVLLSTLATIRCSKSVLICTSAEYPWSEPVPFCTSPEVWVCTSLYFLLLQTFVPFCTSYFCRLFVPFCTSANYHCNEFAFYAQTPLRGKVQFKKPLYFPQINHPSLVPDSSVCKQWL